MTMSWNIWPYSLRRDAMVFARVALCWGILHLIILASYSSIPHPDSASTVLVSTSLFETHGSIHDVGGSPTATEVYLREGKQKRDTHSLKVSPGRHLLDPLGRPTAAHRHKDDTISSRPPHPKFETVTHGAPICNKVDAKDISFTLVTQLSDERLWMMREHCKGWASDVSVAIFTDKPKETVEMELRALGCSRVSVNVLGKASFKSGDYPVNVLRNLAISSVKTSHFLYVDADFWLSHHTDRILMKNDVRRILSNDPKQAIVLPAYQLRYKCTNKKDPTACMNDKVPQMPRTKLQLLDGMNRGNVTVFDPKNPHGHGSTMYDLWMAQRAGTVATIPCLRSERYEPYLVVQHCQSLPPCQEAFTGYGKNKIQWIMHLRRSGYAFAQVGGAFLVHYPHKESVSKKMWAKKQGNKRSELESLFEKLKSWLHTLPDEERLPLCPTAPPNGDGYLHPDDKSNVSAKFERVTRGAPVCKKVDPVDISYTLVTQLSDNRLWMMQRHCEGWKSDVSLAVFTNRTKNSVQTDLVKLGCNRFSLRVLNMADYPGEGEYPVNVLRNLAISAVKTSHFLYIDADFWLSKDTDDVLLKKSVKTTLSKDPKQALVIPAYQLHSKCTKPKDLAGCRKEKSLMMPQTKMDLLERIGDGAVTVFDPKNPRGHGSTLYNLWQAQGTGNVAPIPCLKSDRYEPYLVVQHCRELPPCQEQFTGYGKNKIQWIMHLRRSGYAFSQVGGAFVTHYPHADSKSKKLWNNDSNAKREAVDAIFANFTSWLLTLPDEQRLPLCPPVDDVAGAMMKARATAAERRVHAEK